LNNSQKRSNVDSILSYILIKKLITPIVKTPAYKLSLINSSGKIIKSPTSDEEKLALTALDKICLKLKRLLGGKIATLNNFLYTQNISSNLYNQLNVNGNVEQRAEIVRINQDVSKMLESKGYNFDTFLESVLMERLETYEPELLNE
jgi:hypothetical protein